MASAGILQLSRPLEGAALVPALLPPPTFPEGGVATLWSQMGSSSREAYRQMPRWAADQSGSGFGLTALLGMGGAI